MGRRGSRRGLFLSILLIGTQAAIGSPWPASWATADTIPLNDLGNGLYKSFGGGLYPNGLNQRPFVHDTAGRRLAAQIIPRTTAGNPDPAYGKIVLLSIGMSNTTQEFSTFKTLADTDRARNPRMVIVDGAQGGQTAALIADSNANFWIVVDQRLAAAGVTRSQVQAVWAKEADANPTAPFPRHAQVLDSEYVLISQILRSRFPNLACCYWSSRIYGGYATTSLNPEPYAYESGFAVKWLIETQIRGDTALSFTGPRPKAPWIAWGPYLWAKGSTPRSDGLLWLPSDLGSDGTHPSVSGRLKVAQKLREFFATDSTAVPWFLASRTTSVRPSDGYTGALPSFPHLGQNFPNPFNPTTIVSYQLPVAGQVKIAVYDLLGRELAVLVDRRMAPGNHEVPFDAADLPSGIYVYRMTAGSFIRTMKMVVLK